MRCRWILMGEKVNEYRKLRMGWVAYDCMTMGFLCCLPTQLDMTRIASWIASFALTSWNFEKALYGFLELVINESKMVLINQ